MSHRPPKNRLAHKFKGEKIMIVQPHDDHDEKHTGMDFTIVFGVVVVSTFAFVSAMAYLSRIAY